MSWFDMFSNMSEGKLKKSHNCRYYIFKPGDMIGGGPSIKIVTPTKMNVEQAKSKLKQKLKKPRNKKKLSQSMCGKKKNMKHKKVITKKRPKKVTSLKKKMKNKKTSLKKKSNMKKKKKKKEYNFKLKILNVILLLSVYLPYVSFIECKIKMYKLL